MNSQPVSDANELARLRRRYERERRARLEAEAIAERVTRDALHDPLTGLANRILFMERLQRALDAGARNQKPVAILLLDLDGFKEINDSLGHAAGDSLLIAVAGRIREVASPAITVARLEGDEFALLLEDLHSQDAASLAELINQSLLEPFILQDQSHSVSASVGVACSRAGQKTAAELMRQADIAMDAARSERRAGHAAYETGMHRAIAFRVGMKSDLRRALQDEEFVVHFQPIVALPHGSLQGMEALVRWERAPKHFIPPSDFIPLAEETGLIVPLGWWVLEESCRSFRRWQQVGVEDLTLHVNISAQQLRDPQANAQVLRALRKTGVAPSSLVLELTEGSVMQDVTFSLDALQKLTALGVRISIDDFGTGYSSLSYLQKLPIAGLKIDKSFVDEIARSKEGMALVRAIINLGSALQLELVAEGVEQQAQVDLLHRLGCSLAQGYLFSRPLAAEEIDASLARATSLQLPWPEIVEASTG